MESDEDYTDRLRAEYEKIRARNEALEKQKSKENLLTFEYIVAAITIAVFIFLIGIKVHEWWISPAGRAVYQWYAANGGVVIWGMGSLCLGLLIAMWIFMWREN